MFPVLGGGLQLDEHHTCMGQEIPGICNLFNPDTRNRLANFHLGHWTCQVTVESQLEVRVAGLRALQMLLWGDWTAVLVVG